MSALKSTVWKALNPSGSRLKVWDLWRTTVRLKSYYDSRLEEAPEKYTGVEKSYAEWKYVERLIPPLVVPTPPEEKGKLFPSGWTVPNPSDECDYIVHRTKNHMIPIYLKLKDRGIVKKTVVRRIDGNIWELERDVGNYLKNKYPSKIIVTRTDECSGIVYVNGEYVDDLKEWAESKGF